MLRRRALVGLLLTAAVTMIVKPAAAQSPHFVSCSATPAGDTLVVSFKEAGLGKKTTVVIQASATATATYVCRNRGGTVPKDPKKTTVTSVVSESGTFTSDKNGNVVGTLTLTAPPAPSDFTCPPGQTLELVAGSVSFSDVAVSDLATGAVCYP